MVPAPPCITIMIRFCAAAGKALSARRTIVVAFMAAHFRTVFVALLMVTAPMLAQAPSAHWRTIHTAHFRFHYPEEYEQWTLRAASRIESVRDAVVREVG